MRYIRFTSFLIFYLTFLFNEVQATHIRAGDLSAVRISSGNALTYRFTVILYRDTGGVPAQPGLFEFGYTGAEGVIIDPTSLGFLDDATEIIIYQVEHTFPAPGTYRVSYYEQNRNNGVRNMFASGSTAFYIESRFRMSPALGLNSSPVLLIPPVDKAAIGQRFIHNPGAFDAEGDSLSYRMTICKQGRDQDGNAMEVIQYRFPDDPEFGGIQEDGSGPATFTLNPITGDLIWNTPGQTGEYNVAFYVDEWREGVLISSVNRDMQIIVEDNPNNRPEVIVPRDTCITAGSVLIDTIRAIDEDGDFVILTAEGALFRPPAGGATSDESAFPRHTNQAEFEVLGDQPPNGSERGVFSWQTDCNDIRRRPYQATFKVVDRPGQGSSLADLATWLITVVGPAPDTLVAEADLINNTAALSWNDYACQNAESMSVWRRRGSFDFDPDNCETGLPPYTGYRRVGDVGIDQTSFLDDNNGRGLERGVTYCYRIFAEFPEPGGGESYASDEVCIFIPQLAPYIVEVSVDETSREEGTMDVRWTRPVEVDSVEHPRPWTYVLTRAEELSGGVNAVEIPEIFSEEDTFYVDTGLDTERLPYHYSIALYSQGNLVDTSSYASSPFLTFDPRPGSVVLNWEAEVPWSNASSQFRQHYVYRENPQNEGDFILYDSVDVTQAGFTYEDIGDRPGFGLEEGETYCYKVLTVGTYDNPFIRDSLLNFSQETCAVLQDTTAPCPPVLTLTNPLCETSGRIEDQNADCSALSLVLSNQLSWENDLSGDCDPEIVSYNVYFTPREGGEMALLATNVLDPSFRHFMDTTIAGCYAVTALDPSGNESGFSNIECIDNCVYYELPNVFTPNGDNTNDFFVPFKCPRFVEAVEFKVFNRWGQEIFAKEGDLYINWDGTDNNGNNVPSGVYYYQAKLKTIRLNARDETEIVKGYVHLMRDETPN